jgi:PHB depolymerase-like protein
VPALRRGGRSRGNNGRGYRSGAAAQYDINGRPDRYRVNPTEVNRLATRRSIGWFERKLIGVVPLRYPGALWRVYPGFVQLAAFMSMNLQRHVKAQVDLFSHLANGDKAQAAAIRAFYDEYCAVMDLPAEFYLQTVRTVFQEHALPLGKFEWHGRRVDPRAIRRTALFTVEGERDDICAVGQTLAAQELCRTWALYEATPRSDQRRPLRRVQRSSLEQLHLSDSEEYHLRQRLSGSVAQLLAGDSIAVSAGAVISVVAKSPGMMSSMNSMSSDQSQRLWTIPGRWWTQSPASTRVSTPS